MRRGPLRLAFGVLILGVVAMLTIASIAPPAVRGNDASPSEFSAARALTHVEAIAKTPHPVGSPAHEEVRAYILKVLAGLGLEARVEDTNTALKAAGIVHAAHVKNVIARLPGAHPGPAVLLAAHYDSVPNSRGASDDGSGVATLLETARALVSGPRLQNDVVFLFSDAEEVAACGALAFTQEELTKEPIGVALNFEARGTRGAVALYDTSVDNGALIAAIAKVAPRIVSTSLLASLARTLPNDSDASVWKRAGIPTYAFAYVDHLYQYHQYTDAIDALDPRSLQHDGDYALPLTRALANTPLPLPSASAVAYFDLFGRAVVSYPTWVARALALITLSLFGALVWRTRGGEKVALRGVMLGFAIGVAALALAGLMTGLVHVLLRLAIDPFVLRARPLVATTAALALAVAVVLVVVARFLRDEIVVSTVFGVLSLWAAALAVTGALAPAASFVFQWPLLFALAGTAVWLRRRGAPSVGTDAVFIAALIPASFFWSNLLYTLFVMVGGQAPEVVAVAAVAPMLLALPLFAGEDVRSLRRVGVGAATLSGVIALLGGIAIRKSAELPRPDSLTYVLEGNRIRSAHWTTTHPEGDGFVAQRIPRGQASAKAPLYDVPPLETSAHSEDEGGMRHSTLQVASPRSARCIRMWEATHEPIVRALVNDKPIVDVVRFSAEIDAKIVVLFTGGARPSSWVMEYCGADENGLKVDLFSAAGKPIKLRIIEYSDGLPGPPLAPRSSSDGYPDSESDGIQSMVDVKL